MFSYAKNIIHSAFPFYTMLHSACLSLTRPFVKRTISHFQFSKLYIQVLGGLSQSLKKLYSVKLSLYQASTAEVILRQTFGIKDDMRPHPALDSISLLKKPLVAACKVVPVALR